MSAQPLEAVNEWLDSRPRIILCGKRIPPRPSAPKMAPPDLSWQPEAACRDVPAATSAAFTDAVTQADGAAAAQEWCAHCPVADACLTYGRSYWAWGLHGGMVLLDGKVAPHTSDGLLRRPRLLTAEPAIEPDIEPAPTPPARGQRWQPRRVSRARRLR